MTMPCKAALFDMDDVLCAYDWRGRVAALAQMSGKSFATLDEAIWRSGFEDAADRGEYSSAAYLAAFSCHLGLPLSRADWIANRKAAMSPFPEVLALLGHLQQAGIAIGVLTNNGLLTAEAIDALFPALRPLFGPHIFVSAELGLAKPDPAIYRAACARLGSEPMQTFFVDDLPANVAGAREAGLTAAVFTDAPALRQAMRAAGLPV